MKQQIISRLKAIDYSDSIKIRIIIGITLFRI